MNEQLMENPAILQKWLLKRRSRDDTEKEDIQDEAGECSTVLTHDAGTENNGEAKLVGTVNVADKEKQARVQSVFSMVRSQIRMQACLGGQRGGLMDVVNQANKELEMSQREQEEPVALTVKIPSSEEKTLDQGTQRETGKEGIFEMEKNIKGRDEEGCVALLEEVMLSLESLRKDLREDMAQLRRETQSYMERELCGLETRLTNLLRIQTPATLPLETKKHRPPSMPPLGASRRRMLNRTMTTITPKTCPPLSLRPRCSSEPLRVSGAESTTSTGAPNKGMNEMPYQSPGALPPARPPAQTSKTTLRSRTRVGKPTC